MNFYQVVRPFEIGVFGIDPDRSNKMELLPFRDHLYNFDHNLFWSIDITDCRKILRIRIFEEASLVYSHPRIQK
jgi:hypothetical protein